jgi:hypothetical protein
MSTASVLRVVRRVRRHIAWLCTVERVPDAVVRHSNNKQRESRVGCDGQSSHHETSGGVEVAVMRWTYIHVRRVFALAPEPAPGCCSALEHGRHRPYLITADRWGWNTLKLCHGCLSPFSSLERRRRTPCSSSIPDPNGIPRL